MKTKENKVNNLRIYKPRDFEEYDDAMRNDNVNDIISVEHIFNRYEVDIIPVMKSIFVNHRIYDVNGATYTDEEYEELAEAFYSIFTTGEAKKKMPLRNY